jgi:molecular chaperone HscB
MVTPSQFPALPEDVREQLDARQPDYYAMFGAPERLSLDTAELQTRFYERSRQLHPDRFARAEAKLRQDSMRASSLLNDGYRTLKDPLRRAEYVLSRYGFDIGQQRSNNVPPELLEEVFELNMALDELRSGDDDARPQLEEARERFLKLRDECDTDVAALFVRWDAERQSMPADFVAVQSDNGAGEAPPALQEPLREIRAVLNRRRYIENLVRDVEAALNNGQ